MTTPNRFPGDIQTETISVGRQFIRSNLRRDSAGAFCPCCNLQVVLRKRRIAATAVRVLLELYRYHHNHVHSDWAAYHQRHEPSEWVHIPDFLEHHPGGEFRACVKSREYSRLKHWRLMEPLVVNNAEKAGFYRLLDGGLRFARGDIRVPRWVWVFDDHPYMFSDRRGPFVDMVTVQEALGNDFVYEEIVTPEYIGRTPAEAARIGRSRMRRIRRRG